MLLGGRDGAVEEIAYTKTRADDFITELQHLDTTVIDGTWQSSPIALERALETMLVIAAAHRSARTGRVVDIDYGKGFGLQALA